MKKKLLVNIAYTTIYQIVCLIIPLITGPYLARTLGPEQIGKYSYVLANTNYFLLLINIGLPMYGQIQIASNRDNPDYRNRIFWSIVTLRLFILIPVLALYALFFSFQPKEYYLVYCCFIPFIISTATDISWFVSGMEDLKRNVIRNTVVRLTCIVLILFMVHEPKDLILYALIVQITSFVGNLSMWRVMRGSFMTPAFLSVSRMAILKCSLPYFVPSLIGTIFSSADKTILGAMTSDYEVGFYEEAAKITGLGIGILSATGSAILPRAIYLNNNSQDRNAAYKLFEVSFRIMVMILVPVTFGIVAVSDEFFLLLFGDQYIKSSTLLKIQAPHIAISVMLNLCGQQCLIARGKQKHYNYAVTLGALANVALNIVVAKKFQSVGVSIVTVVSETIAILLVFVFSGDMINMKRIISGNWKYAGSGIAMYLLITRIEVSSSLILMLLYKMITGVIIYGLFLVVLRDSLLIDLKNKLFSRIRTYFNRRNKKHEKGCDDC